MTENVNHPKHYNAHPSGVECIDVVEHMGFNVGNAMKYLWRADEKGAPIEDLQKASWYVDREIAKRLKQSAPVRPDAKCATCKDGTEYPVGKKEVRRDGIDYCPDCGASLEDAIPF